MILKLGMKHQAMELYKVCINHDPGITLTFFDGKVNLGCPCIYLNGKNRKMSINGKKLAGQNIHVYENIFGPDGCLALPRGYIHVYDHNIQTSSLKPLGQSKSNFMWSILRKSE